MTRKQAILALCAYVVSSSLTFPQTARQRTYRIGLLSETTYFSEQVTALQFDAGEQLAGLRQEPASEHQIKQLEEERRQAVLHQDVEKLKGYYADGMTVIDIDGDLHVNTNDASAKLNQPATRTTLKWIIDEIAVKPDGASVAIVIMRVQIEDVLNGIHRNFACRLMHAWVKRNGQWQIVAQHGTEIAATPITADVPQQSVSDRSHETEIEKPAALTPGQQEIFDFHRKLHTAHWRADIGALKQLLTDDWFVARPSGQIITREQFLNSVKPGEPPRLQDQISIRTFGDAAVMTLRTTWPDGRVQRGTEVFVRENGAWKQAANQQTLLKTSSASKTAAANASTTELDPVKLTPEDYSVLLENDRVRVLDWHMQPSVREPMHSHPDNVVYTFDEYKLRLTTAEGKVSELTSKPGTALLMRATTHSPENIGTTEAHALQVELTNPARNPEPQSSDEASVREALAAFVAAFNSRDRARLNELRTPDMDRRSNQNGETLTLNDPSKGTPVMNNAGDNQQWTRTVDKVRFVTPDAAIVDTHGDETRTNTKTGERTVRHVFHTYVVTRGADGAWRVAASRY